jgi:hypothetical protein
MRPSHRVAARAALQIIILVAAALTASASTAVFAPHTYAMTAGKPQTVVETMAAPAPPECGDRFAYTLIAVNGGASTGAVSSASIVLDGVEIIGENDLRGIPETLERTIELRSPSTLSVTIKGGQPGAAMSIAIVADAEEHAVAPIVLTLSAKQQQFESPFAVDGSGPFSITIRNGDAAGLHRVKSGSVTINGNAISLDADAALQRTLVSLAADNVLTADLRGSAGDSITITPSRILDPNACGPTVQFTSPAENSVVSAAELLVRGTATGDPSIGVTVNGFGADIDLSHAGNATDPFTWAVVFPVEPGALDLTAQATIATHKSATATRAVQVTAPLPDSVTLRVDPPTGVAPLSFTASVRIDDSSLVTLWELDLDGDGVFEIHSPTRPSDTPATHATPGMRVVRARVTLTDGSSREASAVVTTVSFQAIDSLLRAAWSRFTGALARQDVDAALAELADDRVRAYYENGLRLIVPELPRVAAGLADISAVRFSVDTAYYLLVRNENGADHGYHVYFVRSADGVWRIAQF